MNKKDFIKKLLKLQVEGKKDEAMDLVYDSSGNLLKLEVMTGHASEDYVTLDELMGDLLSEEMEHWLMMPFLTLTGPYKSKMKNRDAFYGQYVQKCVRKLRDKEMKEEHFLSGVKRLAWEM